jgi:hypothetical protein
MFAVEVKKKEIHHQVFIQKLYSCQHCGVLLETLYGYKINCENCFKGNPTVADLINDKSYRIKFHLSKEKKTPL